MIIPHVLGQKQEGTAGPPAACSVLPEKYAQSWVLPRCLDSADTTRETTTKHLSHDKAITKGWIFADHTFLFLHKKFM